MSRPQERKDDMTHFAGIKDFQMFTRESKTKHYEYVVICRAPYKAVRGQDNEAWQAENWCGRLDLARTKSKALQKYYHEVLIIPVFQKTAAQVKILKEDLARQAKQQQEEGPAAPQENLPPQEITATPAQVEEVINDMGGLIDASEAEKVVISRAVQAAQEEAEEAARMEAYYQAKREEEQAKFKGQEPPEETEEVTAEVIQEALEEAAAAQAEDLAAGKPLKLEGIQPVLDRISEENRQAMRNIETVIRRICEAEEAREAQEEAQEPQEADNIQALALYREEAQDDPEELPEKAGPVPYAPSLICKRCGKLLTGPESIARGYGDKCWRRVWKFIKAGKEPEEPLENDSGEKTDCFRARETRLEILRRIAASDEKCICGAHVDAEHFKSYDHEAGYRIPGYLNPQWIYTKCPQCGHENSLRKMVTVDIDDLETEGRLEAGARLAAEEAAAAAKKGKGAA